MKKILIIAGPNGAGKTTFATEFLPNEAGCAEFVNADLIAAGLSPFRSEQLAFTAGRLMLSRIQELAAAGQSFAFETTLSTRSFLRMIPTWQRQGYLIELHFLSLPDAAFAATRVQRRVRLGGHDIPPATISRRFERGLENLREGYLAIVDRWAIYDGSVNPPILVDTGSNPKPRNLMEDPAPYRSSPAKRHSDDTVKDPYFLGAEAALKRGAAKAVARDLAAGLKPIVRNPDDEPNKP